MKKEIKKQPKKQLAEVRFFRIILDANGDEITEEILLNEKGE